jgi:hypothetical protein
VVLFRFKDFSSDEERKCTYIARTARIVKREKNLLVRYDFIREIVSNYI